MSSLRLQLLSYRVDLIQHILVRHEPLTHEDSAQGLLLAKNAP